MVSAMKYVIGLFLVLIACRAHCSVSDSYLYVSYSPDKRYSPNGLDSRIALIPGERLFGYGHGFGQMFPCMTGRSDCVSFSGMAVLQLPESTVVGDAFDVGEYHFQVKAQQSLLLLGCSYDALRVEVRKNNEFSNSFLFSATKGVIAIGTKNAEDENVPELLFLLAGDEGLFARKGDEGN